jgi:hypothetical protein
MAPGLTSAPVGQPASRQHYFSGIPGIDKTTSTATKYESPTGCLPHLNHSAKGSLSQWLRAQILLTAS